MSERGVYAIDRGIWEHEAFRDQPFTDREAWMWLVGEAAFKPRTRNIAGKVIELIRGQLAASVRFMAERWKWSKSSVDRFLDRLKKRDMIETDSGTGLLVITICKYEEYQRVSLPTGTPIGTETGTAAGQQRDKRENTKSTKEEDTCADASAPRTKRDYSEKFEEAWQAYPKRDGGNPKPPAGKLFLAAVKAGEDPQKIIDGVKRFAVSEARNIGTPYIPQMVKWLRDKRWLDDGQGQSATIFNIRAHLV